MCSLEHSALSSEDAGVYQWCFLKPLTLIQALRAFCRAEVIVDAVLFESRVGGVAVAMTFASIFHFEFWFLWGVFLMLFWMPFGSLLDPKCVAWGPFGVVWGCFGSLFRVFGRHFGCCGVPWGSFGGPRALLGRPWAPRGRFPGFSGKFREPFWLHFGLIFHVFLVLFRDLFFHRFLKRFCIDLGVILEAFLESFFGDFPSSRKMLHPTKTL